MFSLNTKHHNIKSNLLQPMTYLCIKIKITHAQMRYTLLHTLGINDFD